MPRPVDELVAALEAALDIPVYSTPEDMVVAPSVLILPSNPWVERVTMGACTRRWFYEALVVARRADVSGALTVLEAAVIDITNADIGSAGAWQTIDPPITYDIAGIEYLAAVVRYELLT